MCLPMTYLYPQLQLWDSTFLRFYQFLLFTSELTSELLAIRMHLNSFHLSKKFIFENKKNKMSISDPCFLYIFKFVVSKTVNIFKLWISFLLILSFENGFSGFEIISQHDSILLIMLITESKTISFILLLVILENKKYNFC